MIVHVRKNAVAPHIAPAVCAKGALDDALRAWPEREIDGAAIDQQRQARIVGDGSVVAKHQRERLGGSARYRHGPHPSGFAPPLLTLPAPAGCAAARPAKHRTSPR